MLLCRWLWNWYKGKPDPVTIFRESAESENPTGEQLKGIQRIGLEKLTELTPTSSASDQRLIQPSCGPNVLSKIQSTTVRTIDLQQAYGGKFFFLSHRCELSCNFHFQVIFKKRKKY